jgi:conjugative relaxase-like TrwC/TraI family protein
MMRVTTLYAGTAAITAAYYTAYLTRAEGELPGKWMGQQAHAFGLSGDVTTEQLEALLSGRDPIDGTPLGQPLVDRVKTDGTVIRAVAGFDATLSAPKSLSAWWALTGDDRLAQCHDIAVEAVVREIERFGATTRVRHNGGRLHPETIGLTVAAFRQSTSRADDPQLHTHVVISSKVQTDEGHWRALDARLLKGHQRAFGGLYQSVLRAELTNRFGVTFGDIVNGQAEIEGVPEALLDQFSKRTIEVNQAVADKLVDFWEREGRDPTSIERAAIRRESAADTRRHKTGDGVPDLRTRWRTEARELGVTAKSLSASVAAAHRPEPRQRTRAQQIIEQLSTERSSWHRMDVLRVVTDTLRPVAEMSGERWDAALSRAVDTVMNNCIDLDPAGATEAQQRTSDHRSVWIEPVAPHMTSDAVLRQEEYILSFGIEAQALDASPSTTIRTKNLDALQADAAASVAGHDRLVLVVGPAGTGKTTMLRAAATDFDEAQQPAFGFAPTAKAAQVLRDETGFATDTVAKLLHEWTRPDRGPDRGYRLAAGSTLVVDEAGMLTTFDLYSLMHLAERNEWRLALIGDPRQLSAVGRGGMFDELCATGRVVELQRVHRFTEPWEAAASLGVRRGDARALDAYEFRGRVVAAPLAEHVKVIADRWLDAFDHGRTLAITTTTNEHVDRINEAIQARRLGRGELRDDVHAEIAGGAHAYVGDIVATRQNDRRLRTDLNEPVRNRDLWTVQSIAADGGLTATKLHGHGTVTLPTAYLGDHVRLGYAATEYGHQSLTTHASLTLATGAMNGRGLYVAMTRGRHDNTALVVTDSHDVSDARDVLERILANDRPDLPATAQRRQLAAQDRTVPAPAARPAPRCAVPDVASELLRAAEYELTNVHQLMHEVPARRVQLMDASAIADRAVADASRRHSPFAQQLKEANDKLDEARIARRSAEADLREANALTRRGLRRRLADATHVVEAALVNVSKADAAALPTATALGSARDDARRCRTEIGRNEVAERYDYPNRLNDAERLINTLETWLDWAEGRDITPVVTVDLLNKLEAIDDRRIHGLTRPLETWLIDRGVEPRPRQRVVERSMDFGIEL